MEDPIPNSNPTPNLEPATNPNSPEFEFCVLPNPVLSPAELFSGGFLRRFTPEPDTTEPSISASKPGSNRWKDLFKRPDKPKKDNTKREKTPVQLGPGSAAELNINIWPFIRSRSAGNSGSGRKWAGSARKATSAPCSRSNSASESKSRKWPSSPGRPGVHVGRASPVWQPRRAGPGRKGPQALGPAGEGAKARVEDLKVSACIGYRNCGTRAGGASGGGAGLFNIRSLFTKKVY